MQAEALSIAELLAIPLMSEALVVIITSFMSLFMRGIQFKNVQHSRKLNSGITSFIIKLFDLVAILFTVHAVNLWLILFASIAAGAGTVLALMVEDRIKR